MAWFSNELTAEQQRQVDLIRQEYETDLEDHKLEVRRTSRKEVQQLKDRIAEVEGWNFALKGLKATSSELHTRELELDSRDRALDGRDELLDQREINARTLRDMHDQDMETHHDKINELQAAAEVDRKAAADVLSKAQVASFERGKAEGYSEGLKDGINRVAVSANEARAEANDTAKLLALAGTVNRTTTVTDGKQEDPASKVLADAFAKHLSGIVDKVMTPKKETK